MLYFYGDLLVAMVSFENTEIAFSGKSDQDLKRAFWLFRMVGRPWLVKMGKAFTHLALKIHFPIRRLIKTTIFRQFCGGESIDECDVTVSELARFKIGTILDYSVEGQTREEDFDATASEIIATIRKGDQSDSIPFAVFKVTGISRFRLLEKVDAGNELTEKEKAEFGRVKNRMDAICKTSFETGIPVFVDAEESWIQDTIDQLATEMMEQYNREKANVYNTIQVYRHDRLKYLKKASEEAQKKGYQLGIKLVRGAYMEKERKRATEKAYPSPIQPDKTSADRDYDLALEFCTDHADHIWLVAGTHNENSAMYLTRLMVHCGIEKASPRVWFAQLYGMGDHISFNLANAGYNVAKYVPYGPIREVLPYLIRRAEENTSVAGQTSRELTLIITEQKRRKGAK